MKRQRVEATVNRGCAMTPAREFLFEQATACRQLALISEPEVAAKLKTLAREYETEALIDQALVATVKPVRPQRSAR